jgi:protein transport protein SEC24
MPLQIVRQKVDAFEIEFINLMVEDKNNDFMSYVDYLCQLHRLIHNEINNS